MTIFLTSFNAYLLGVHRKSLVFVNIVNNTIPEQIINCQTRTVRRSFDGGAYSPDPSVSELIIQIALPRSEKFAGTLSWLNM